MGLLKIGSWAVALLWIGRAAAATLYVSPTGSHTPPFADWSTAATDIQSALDATSLGDTVLVADGLYLVGTPLTVERPIQLQSENGPSGCIVEASGANALLTVQNSGGGTIEGITFRHGMGMSLDIQSAISLRSCVIDDVLSVELQAGCMLDGCVISNTASLGAYELIASNCTFGSDSSHMPPHVRFTGRGTNRLTECRMIGAVEFLSSPQPPVWHMETARVDGSLWVTSARIEGNFSGAGELSIDHCEVVDATFTDLAHVACSGVLFDGCRFGGDSPSPWGPAVRLLSRSDGPTNRLVDCWLGHGVEFNTVGFQDGTWEMERVDLAGSADAHYAIFRGDLTGNGEFNVWGGLLDGMAITNLSRLNCAGTLLRDCVFGTDASPPMFPHVQLDVLTAAGAVTNQLERCSLRGWIRFEDAGPGGGTWQCTSVLVTRTVTAGNVELTGSFLGIIPGYLDFYGTLVRAATFTDLTCIAQSAQFFDCDFLGGAGRGVELRSGSLFSHGRVRGYQNGGIRCKASEVRNSEIAGNQTMGDPGGGVWLENGGRLSSCTVWGNSAGQGGGIYAGDDAAIDNSIVWNNSATEGANWFEGGTNTVWHHSCSAPTPTGTGNLGDDPGLIPGSSEFAANSPCIDAGSIEPWMSGETDVYGHPRIIGGLPDIGAFEHVFSETDFDGDGLSNDVEVTQYGSDPASGDSDGDGQSDAEEAVAGTGLTNAQSSFAWPASAPPAPQAGGITLRWTSLAGRTYTVLRYTSLLTPPDVIASGLAATPPLNTFTDNSPPPGNACCYRVAVGMQN